MSKIYKPEALPGENLYTFGEVCERQSLEEEFIIQCVDYGIIEVSGGQHKQDWLFSFAVISRLEKARRLHTDLGIDYSALALVLELLDEINDLRSINNLLNSRLERWENKQH